MFILCKGIRTINIRTAALRHHSVCSFMRKPWDASPRDARMHATCQPCNALRDDFSTKNEQVSQILKHN